MGAVTDQLPDAASIRGLLAGTTSWGPVEVVASTGSTNADVSVRAHAGQDAGLVLISMEQTAGRGRRTRQWASPRGASISMSVLLEPRHSIEKWGWLSLLAGLAVSDALSSLAPDNVAVELKWPNDVLLDGRKVCGILSEACMTPSGHKAVVGIGINVALAPEQLPVPTATSLGLHGMTQDQSLVCAEVLRALEGHVEQWQEIGDLRETYSARCASIGRELSISVEDGHPLPGRGVGIDADGCLVVDTATGLRAFAVGDVVHARLA